MDAVLMPPQVSSLPTASGNFPGGSVSAPAGAFYSNTAPAVSAGVVPPYPKAPASLIRGAATLLFAALLTFGMGHTATKAVANLAHDMQPKGW